MNKKERVSRLFDLYSQNLALINAIPEIHIEPEITEPTFICPLCLAYFTRNDIDGLRLEHIPPKSVGGTDGNAIITCETCNNNAGSSIEADLANRLLFQGISRGIPGLKMKVSSHFHIGDEKYKHKHTLETNEDGLLLYGDKEHTNPDVFEAISNKPFDSISYPENINRMAHKPAVIAMLKSAYLKMFKVFGYASIASPPMQKIREQIQKPNETIVRGSCIREWGFSDSMLGVNVVRVPEDIKSYLIVLDFGRDKLKRRFGIFLPKIDDIDLEVYVKLGDKYHTDDKPVLSGENFLDLPHFLTNPEYIMLCHQRW